MGNVNLKFSSISDESIHNTIDELFNLSKDISLVLMERCLEDLLKKQKKNKSITKRDFVDANLSILLSACAHALVRQFDDVKDLKSSKFTVNENNLLNVTISRKYLNKELHYIAKIKSQIMQCAEKNAFSILKIHEDTGICPTFIKNVLLEGELKELFEEKYFVNLEDSNIDRIRDSFATRWTRILTVVFQNNIISKYSIEAKRALAAFIPPHRYISEGCEEKETCWGNNINKNIGMSYHEMFLKFVEKKNND